AAKQDGRPVIAYRTVLRKRTGTRAWEEGRSAAAMAHAAPPAGAALPCAPPLDVPSPPRQGALLPRLWLFPPLPFQPPPWPSPPLRPFPPPFPLPPSPWRRALPPPAHVRAPPPRPSH